MPMPVRILRRLNSRDRFTEEIIYIYISNIVSNFDSKKKESIHVEGGRKLCTTSFEVKAK